LEVCPGVSATADGRGRLHTWELGHKDPQGKDPVALQRPCACWILVLAGFLFAQMSFSRR